jgi:hypothetical protein
VPSQDLPPPQPGHLGDFLQPQSMVTPGLLGALVMMGTNSLCTKFPGLNGAVVALVLSLLFGLAAVIREAPLAQRVLFYVLNSIVIFSVATGTNTVGQASRLSQLSVVSTAYAERRDERGEAPLHHTQMAAGFFHEWFPSRQGGKPAPPPPIQAPKQPKDSGPTKPPPDRNTDNPSVITVPPPPPH